MPGFGLPCGEWSSRTGHTCPSGFSPHLGLTSMRHEKQKSHRSRASSLELICRCCSRPHQPRPEHLPSGAERMRRGRRGAAALSQALPGGKPTTLQASSHGPGRGTEARRRVPVLLLQIPRSQASTLAVQMACAHSVPDGVKYSPELPTDLTGQDSYSGGRIPRGGDSGRKGNLPSLLPVGSPKATHGRLETQRCVSSVSKQEAGSLGTWAQT